MQEMQARHPELAAKPRMPRKTNAGAL